MYEISKVNLLLNDMILNIPFASDSDLGKDFIQFIVNYL